MRRTVVAATLASSLAACSLLTDFDGLTAGGPGSPADGAAPSDSALGEAAMEGSAPGPPDAAGREGSTDGPPPTSPYEAAVLADGPLAYFELDDAPGTTAIDRMGGPAAVYASSGIAFAQSGAFAGSRAVALDGVAGRISLGDRFPFAGNAPFTIEIWLKPSVIDASVRWLVNRCAGDPANTNSFGILAYTNNTLFQRLTPGGETYAQGPVLAVSKFVHVVATFDGAQNSLYLDGALAAAGVAGAGAMTNVPGSELLVGDTQLPRTAKLAGIVDELAIYDKALTPGRVMAHFVAAAP